MFRQLSLKEDPVLSKMLRQQLTKVRCRWLDRLPLIFSTMLVLVIYNISKPASNNLIILETETTEFSTTDQTSVVKERFSYSTQSALSHNESTRFNPFKNPPNSNMNDVMTAYTYNSFGLDEVKELPMKTILFLNEAYGSKDYGKHRNYRNEITNIYFALK